MCAALLSSRTSEICTQRSNGALAIFSNLPGTNQRVIDMSVKKTAGSDRK